MEPTKEHKGFHEYKNGQRFNPDCPACRGIITTKDTCADCGVELTGISQVKEKKWGGKRNGVLSVENVVGRSDEGY